MTFCSLNEIIDELVAEERGIINRVKWALKEKEILKLAERLGRLQNTLGIMVNIANG